MSSKHSAQEANGKFKRWCFTTWKGDPVWNKLIMQYIVWQYERCPKTDKLHCQGYCEFKEGVRMSRVKFWLGADHSDGGASIHLTKAAGSAAENKIYCTKSDSRVAEGEEHGEPAKREQGRRTDLEGLRADALDETKSEYDVATSNLAWFRYHRAFNRLRGMAGRRRNTTLGYCQRIITWYSGDPGLGKSRRAAYEAIAAPGRVFSKSSDTRWFDGYDGEENVIIDDIDGDSGMSVGTWKRLLDGYPQQVEVKGAFTPWMARRIWITSNHTADQWIDGVAKSLVDRQALRRRITHEIPFSSEWTPPHPPAAVEENEDASIGTISEEEQDEVDGVIDLTN